MSLNKLFKITDRIFFSNKTNGEMTRLFFNKQLVILGTWVYILSHVAVFSIPLLPVYPLYIHFFLNQKSLKKKFSVDI